MALDTAKFFIKNPTMRTADIKDPKKDYIQIRAKLDILDAWDVLREKKHLRETSTRNERYTDSELATGSSESDYSSEVTYELRSTYPHEIKGEF